MPFVDIAILEGRSDEVKEKLIQNVSQSVAESLAIPIERVHIQLRDMSPYECGSGGKSAAELMGLKD